MQEELRYLHQREEYGLRNRTVPWEAIGEEVVRTCVIPLAWACVEQLSDMARDDDVYSLWLSWTCPFQDNDTRRIQRQLLRSLNAEKCGQSPLALEDLAL